MATTENTSFSNQVRRMLGLTLDTWNDIMLLFLGIAAIAAAFVGVSTYATIQLSKQEAADSKRDFEKYKLDAGEKISEADARAKEANQKAGEADLARLKLEEKLAPRRLSVEQQKAIADSLEVFKGSKVRIEPYSLDAEGEVLATQIRDALALIFAIDDWVGSERGANGFAKGVNITGRDISLVTKLAEVLGTSGLSQISTAPLPPQQQSYLLLEESREKAPDVAAVILVGVKPLPRLGHSLNRPRKGKKRPKLERRPVGATLTTGARLCQARHNRPNLVRRF